jgi:hypothetical protein
MSFQARAQMLLQVIRQARDILDSDEINVPSLVQKVDVIEKGVTNAQSAFSKQVAPLLADIGAGVNISKTFLGGYKLKSMPRISDMDDKLAELQDRAKNARNAKAATKKSANNALSKQKEADNAAKKAKSNTAVKQAIRNKLNALEKKIGNNRLRLPQQSLLNSLPRHRSLMQKSTRQVLINRYDSLNNAVKIGLRNNMDVQNLVGNKPNSNFNKNRLNRINSVIKNATS